MPYYIKQQLKMNEEINYNDWVLDPEKDVMVPIQVWLTLFRVMQGVEKTLCKVETQDVYSWYHKDTLKPLSNKSKISQEKLEKDYIKQINLEKTKENRIVTRDPDGLSMAALELLGAFDHVFKQNIDKGNRLPRPTPQGQVPTAVVPGPVLVTDDETSSENED